MEPNEKRQMLRVPIFVMGCVALFWSIYFLIAGNIPVVEKLTLFSLPSDSFWGIPTEYQLPFPVSRLWDILFAGILVIVGLSAKRMYKNNKDYHIGFLIGFFFGLFVGLLVGLFVGLLVGLLVGLFVGLLVGLFTGLLVRIGVGLLIGSDAECLVGFLVGLLTGLLVAIGVGLFIELGVGIGPGLLVVIGAGIGVGIGAGIKFIFLLFTEGKLKNWLAGK